VRLAQCADVLATTSSNVLLYAAIDGWRRQMVQHGTQLIGDALALTERTREAIERIPGLHVLRDELLSEEASHDYDPMHVLVDVSELGVSGYQVADWLRAEHRIDVGINDHRRVEATMSIADDDESAGRLLAALEQLPDAAKGMPEPPKVALPTAKDLEPVMAALPRDAFFGPVETVPAAEAVGRVAAEQVTPYPPGIPALLPGATINAAVVEYLRTGLAAGMVIPDVADASLQTLRVARELPHEE
jgi:arginine/lysine/ornithine decarboxylase